nr:FkbM family methyltransferase [Micromonospora sp. DSM 115978]
MTVDTAAVLESLKSDPVTAALRTSLEFYYGDPARDAAMDAFYARFVRPGDLVFDVGSHVGDRIGSFRRLGARVVAVEPQPSCAHAIRALYGDDGVTLVEAVCAARAGTLRFRVNSANPTVSTASSEFVAAAAGAAGWEGQRWDAETEVPSVTLDMLISEYGEPAFAKVDVEGFEDAVLAGLGRPLTALSFEFTTIQRAVADRCLDRLAGLGFDGFDVALGESMALTFGHWISGAEMAEHLRSLPHEANAGDVYAVRRPQRSEESTG